jgi:hypothetical protein
MSNRLASYFIAGALVSALAMASPALARGMGGGMGMGGGHSMGGGMGMGGGRSMGGGAWGGGSMGMHSMGMMGHPMGVAPHVGARSFGAMPMSRAAFGPSFSRPSTAFTPRTAFMPRTAFVHPHPFFFHHRFHHFRRFAFVGGPIIYAGYNDCWRQVWTRFGLQWVNVCGYYDYNYGY